MVDYIVVGPVTTCKNYSYTLIVTNGIGNEVMRSNSISVITDK